MKMKNKRIFDLFTSDDYGAGTFIFNAIYNMLVDGEIDLPNWMPDELTAVTLDYDYCTVVSGDKKISHSACRYYDVIASGDFEAFMNAQAHLIYSRFNVKWVKLFEALNAEYNPIENYNLYEKETPDLIDTSSVKTDVTAETSASSYDSDDFEPVSKLHTTGQDTNNVIKLTKKGNRVLERSGNIGTTTTQQMIESEFELRKHDIYMVIYNDVDTILTNLKW